MTKWLMTLGAALLAVALVVPAAAQDQGNKGAEKKPGAAAKKGAKGAKGGGKMKAVMAKLNLTADQKSKIDLILKESREETKKLRASNATPEEKKAKGRELRKQSTDKIMAVLTPEQQKLAKEEMKKNAADAKGKAKAKKAASKGAAKGEKTKL